MKRKDDAPSLASKSLFANLLGHHQAHRQVVKPDPSQAAPLTDSVNRYLNPTMPRLVSLPSLLSPMPPPKDKFEFDVCDEDLVANSASPSVSSGSASLSSLASSDASESEWEPSADSSPQGSDLPLARKRRSPKAASEPLTSRTANDESTTQHKAAKVKRATAQPLRAEEPGLNHETPLNKPSSNTLQLHCDNPQTLARNSAKLVLVELPPLFDVHGDVGVVGRVCGEHNSTRTHDHITVNSDSDADASPCPPKNHRPLSSAAVNPNHVTLDLKGKLYALSAMPLNGIAMIVNVNAKGGIASIQSLFSAVHTSADMGIDLDEDLDHCDQLAAFDLPDHDLDDHMNQSARGCVHDFATAPRKGRGKGVGGVVGKRGTGVSKRGRGRGGRGQHGLKGGMGKGRIANKKQTQPTLSHDDQMGAQAVLNARDMSKSRKGPGKKQASKKA